MDETLDIEIIKTPYERNLELLYNHISRYSYAIHKLNINKNDIVIDYGCGKGYGSLMIGKKAYKTIGIDKNKDYLHTAMKYNINNNIMFVNNDLDFIKKLDNVKFICIECIEHMQQKEQIILLEIIKSISKEVFLTFPIGENKKSEYNKYHLCEPDLNFIYNNLKDRFKKIELEIYEYKNSFGYMQSNCFLTGR